MLRHWIWDGGGGIVSESVGDLYCYPFNGNICTFRNVRWRVVQFFFPICPVQYSFSWNLDTKFCLHAAGGIYVEHNFTHSGGRVDISGSSAESNGGAVLRSSSWVFGRIWRWPQAL